MNSCILSETAKGNKYKCRLLYEVNFILNKEEERKRSGKALTSIFVPRNYFQVLQLLVSCKDFTKSSKRVSFCSIEKSAFPP